MNFLLILFFFSEESFYSKEKKEGVFSWREGLKVLRPTVLYLLYFFFAVYFITQMNILPYYFERIDKIPFHLGWALTLNPILIIFFQRHVTKIFKFLEEKKEHLAIATGFASIGLSFLILKIDPYYCLFPFIVFLTLGEMLIGPHIDFLITKKMIVSKQFVFALTGIMFALGRAFSESGGITGLEHLRLLGHDNLWWYFDAILAAGITFGVLLFSRHNQCLTRKGGEVMNSAYETIDIDQLEDESGGTLNTVDGG